MRVLLALLISVLSAAAQTVEGSVFDASTGDGVAGVKVELLRGTTPFFETTTDGAGRFRFDDIRENDYSIRYQSPDYWLSAGPTDYKPFHVSAANPVKLEVRMMPWSRISGRVVDGRGRPVPKARVEVTGQGMVVNGRTYLRTSWGGGGGGQLSEASLTMTHNGTADDGGRFEVGLMPGAYQISVLPPADLPAPEGSAWKRTWYPGTAAPEMAEKIVVLGGGEVSGLEVKLQALPAHAVRGVVLNPDGSPAGKLQVSVGEVFRATSVQSKADGTFEFPAVAEGEWRFSAEVDKGSVRLRAVEYVEVERHDLENLKLHLLAPLSLHGRVVADPPSDTPPQDLRSLMLTTGGFRSRVGGDLRPGEAALITPDRSGTFTVEGAYPGTYRLSVMFQPPTAPYYLDAVMLGEANLVLGEAEIVSAGELTVVYKAGSGSVNGAAEKCNSGGVVLVPQDPALRDKGFSRASPCDANGRYEVRGLRPGDYYAVAVAGNGPVPAFNETLYRQATKVTVKAGETATADLRALTKPVF